MPLPVANTPNNWWYQTQNHKKIPPSAECTATLDALMTGQPVAPVNTVAPVISGTAAVGQTLSCTTGTWTGNPAPSFSYQWRANGVAIGGATAPTYLLTVTEQTKTITCVVTATNTSGAPTATSNTLGPVV